MSNYISIILPKLAKYYEMSHLIRVIVCFLYKFDINYFEICSFQVIIMENVCLNLFTKLLLYRRSLEVKVFHSLVIYFSLENIIVFSCFPWVGVTNRFEKVNITIIWYLDVIVIEFNHSTKYSTKMIIQFIQFNAAFGMISALSLLVDATSFF